MMLEGGMLLAGWEYALRLMAACLCGALVGFERKRRHKDAGIRTHVLVSLGSCLMTIVSKYGFLDVVGISGVSVDVSRVAANVITGIGFLGAGVIFLRGRSITGLTTAAGIWTMSGIGLSIGAGMYLLGVTATLLVVVLQSVMHRVLPTYESMAQWQVTVTLREGDSPEALRQALRQVPHMEVQGFHVTRHSDGAVQVRLVCQSPNGLDVESALRLLECCPEVTEVKKNS